MSFAEKIKIELKILCRRCLRKVSRQRKTSPAKKNPSLRLRRLFVETSSTIRWDFVDKLFAMCRWALTQAENRDFWRPKTLLFSTISTNINWSKCLFMSFFNFSSKKQLFDMICSWFSSFWFWAEVAGELAGAELAEMPWTKAWRPRAVRNHNSPLQAKM